jgi:uncharacterized integral membrane protein
MREARLTCAMSTQSDPNPARASQDEPGAAAIPEHHVIRRTRAGGLWVALAVSVVVLVLLLVFILENGQRVDLGFFGAHATLPLGVALLLAAAAGALIVVIPGTGRILQLRIIARRHRRHDALAAHAQPPGDSEP